MQDDGPGIPEALTGQIFEPFFSTKGVGQGIGNLGLSDRPSGSQKRMAAVLTVLQTSAGACFRLALPAAAAQQASVSEESALPDVRKPWPGCRALVADDELPLRQLLQRLLITRGFVVDVAEHGHAAMALLEKHQYDIIFCDVSMPKMGGLAVYEQLQTSQPHLVRTFVLITGEIFDARIGTLAARGTIPILSKPFSVAKLSAVVDHVMVDRSLTPAGRAS